MVAVPERFSLLNSSKRRPFSYDFRLAAPPNSMAFGMPSGSQSAPSSYFTARPSLPANTIIRFVPQQTAWIVERMGKFNRILQPGFAILIPFLDRIAYVKSLKEAAIEIPSQSAITADNVTLELDGVLYTRVFDAYKARLVIGIIWKEKCLTDALITATGSKMPNMRFLNLRRQRCDLKSDSSPWTTFSKSEQR